MMRFYSFRVLLLVQLFGLSLLVKADEPSKPKAVKQVDPAAPAKGTPACCCQALNDAKNAPLAEKLVLNFRPFTKWIPAEQRKKVDWQQVGFTDQSGRTGKLADFAGRPIAVSFFYSRCENSLKCSTTVAKFAELQRSLGAEGLSEKVTLLLISFEPQYDTPGRLTSYGKTRGVQCDNDCRMLQLDAKSMADVVEALEVPVNFNSGWVNIHGISLYLVDHQGKLARKYHTVMWDNKAVVADITKLASESK